MGLMGVFLMNFFGILLKFFGGFFILNFFLFINTDKNKFFYTYSYQKSTLKYSRSNLGNQQSDLPWKIAKKNKYNPISGGFFHV